MKRGQTVLITGGTRGLGKAIGIEFARTDAAVFLTHRRSGVDEGELVAEFTSRGLAPPRIFSCDVADSEGTREVMRSILDARGRLDVVVSNVALAKMVRGLDDLQKRSMDRSLAYSAWPVVDLVQAAHEIFGAFPRYVVGISSDGGELCHRNYDLAGVSKAALETLCRYLALRLKPHGTCVNAIRPGYLDTETSRMTLGDDTFAAIEKKVPDLILDPNEVARVCVALCSGYMDAVKGQVITVDDGWGLVSQSEWLRM